MCPHARRRWSGLPSLLPHAAARRRFERLCSTRSSNAMFKSGQRSAPQAQWSRLQHWVTSDKTHIEHNETALILIADMPRDMDFCCNGPLPDSCTATKGIDLFDHLVGARKES